MYGQKTENFNKLKKIKENNKNVGRKNRKILNKKTLLKSPNFIINFLN